MTTREQLEALIYHLSEEQAAMIIDCVSSMVDPGDQIEPPADWDSGLVYSSSCIELTPGIPQVVCRDSHLMYITNHSTRAVYIGPSSDPGILGSRLRLGPGYELDLSHWPTSTPIHILGNSPGRVECSYVGHRSDLLRPQSPTPQPGNCSHQWVATPGFSRVYVDCLVCGTRQEDTLCN